MAKNENHYLTVNITKAENIREVINILQEKLAEVETLRVGDYAKIVNSINGREGRVVSVKSTTEHSFFCEEVITGRTFYGKLHQIVKATEEEIEQAKLEKQFSKIGRQPNEFKKGDIVEVTGEMHGKKYYGEIEGLTPRTQVERYYFRQFGDEYKHSEKVTTIKLITPVESRFDRA